MIHDGAIQESAVASARGIPVLDRPVTDVLERALSGKPPLYANRDGIGYVLLTLEPGLVEVVNEGGDSDTNAALAGALLGARFGAGSVPGRWLHALRDADRVEATVLALVVPLFGER